jgi:hypothetical protein
MIYKNKIHLKAPEENPGHIKAFNSKENLTNY